MEQPTAHTATSDNLSLSGNLSHFKSHKEHAGGNPAEEAIAVIGQNLDLSMREDLEDYRGALAEALYVAGQRRAAELTNTLNVERYKLCLSPEILAHPAALNAALQSKHDELTTLLKLNGNMPIADKLRYAASNPIRGLLIGHVEYVGYGDMKTRLLREQVNQAIRNPDTVLDANTGQRILMKEMLLEEARRKISYDINLDGGYAVATRTLDLAVFNDSNDGIVPPAPEYGGRMDGAIRNRSVHLLKLDDPKLARPFKIYKNFCNEHGVLPSDLEEIVTADSQESNIEIASLDDSQIEQVTQALVELKSFLDGLIEGLIAKPGDRLVSVSNTYYIRHYKEAELSKKPNPSLGGFILRAS